MANIREEFLVCPIRGQYLITTISSWAWHYSSLSGIQLKWHYGCGRGPEPSIMRLSTNAGGFNLIHCYQIYIFTWGQPWPSGIVLLMFVCFCVCGFMCPCVCVCQPQAFPQKLLWGNGRLTLTFKVKFNLKVEIYLIIPPASTKLKGGVYWFHLVRLSVCGQNRVPSVSSTILMGSISYLHILSSNFRRCVTCNVCFKILKFEILANSFNL